MVCRQGLGSTLVELGLADRTIDIVKNQAESYKQARNTLQKMSIDFIFCPHQSYRTALLVKSLRVRKAKVGFQWWGSRFVFDKRVVYDRQWPDALRQVSLLKAVSPEFQQLWQKMASSGSLKNPTEVSSDVDFRKSAIPAWASMRVPTSSGLKGRKRQVILVPGSVWATKKWTLSGFQEVAEHFARLRYDVLLLGSEAESELCEQIKNRVPSAQNLAGKLKLLESIRLMEQSELIFSNDSGAMHLASIAGVPTVALFGPTVLGLGYRPWNQNAIVVQKALSCRPCGKHGHQKCPVGTHECMKSITSVQVLVAAESLLKSHESSSE